LKAELKSLKMGPISLKMGLISLQVGLITLKVGLIRLKMGLISLQVGLIILKVGLISLKMGLISLQVGLIRFPETSVTMNLRCVTCQKIRSHVKYCQYKKVTEERFFKLIKVVILSEVHRCSENLLAIPKF
jgi:hypothetical protein